MLRFAFKRLGFMLIVLLIVSAITFLLLKLAPGDPARQMAGPRASAQQVEALRSELGLNDPPLLQYGRYMVGAFTLDFGASTATGKPVMSEIAARLPATFELMLSSLVIAIGIGLPLGVAAAVKPGSAFSGIARIASIAGSAMPAYWLGLILVILFYRELNWFPASGRFTGPPPPDVTGFYTLDALITGDFTKLRIAVAHLALPALSMALLELGIYARLVKNQTLGVLSQPYVRVAKAGGLKDSIVIRRHVLRNVMAPLITILAVGLATMLYGSVSVETVFGWPGAGRYIVDSVFRLDFPVIMGFTFLAASALVVVNALADIIQAAIDPRVRLG